MATQAPSSSQSSPHVLGAMNEELGRGQPLSHSQTPTKGRELWQAASVPNDDTTAVWPLPLPGRPREPTGATSQAPRDKCPRCHQLQALMPTAPTVLSSGNPHASLGKRTEAWRPSQLARLCSCPHTDRNGWAWKLTHTVTHTDTVTYMETHKETHAGNPGMEAHAREQSHVDTRPPPPEWLLQL